MSSSFAMSSSVDVVVSGLCRDCRISGIHLVRDLFPWVLSLECRPSSSSIHDSHEESESFFVQMFSFPSFLLSHDDDDVSVFPVYTFLYQKKAIFILRNQCRASRSKDLHARLWPPFASS